MNELLLEEINRYYRLWREGVFFYEEWAKKRGLSYNAVMVLYSIYQQKEDCTQKLISEKWFIPKQTVNTILKDFEKRNFITLLPLPSDKRNKVIHATPTGAEYANRIISELREVELYVMKHFGLERVKHFNDELAFFNLLFQKGAEYQNE